MSKAGRLMEAIKVPQDMKMSSAIKDTLWAMWKDMETREGRWLSRNVTRDAFNRFLLKYLNEITQELSDYAPGQIDNDNKAIDILMSYHKKLYDDIKAEMLRVLRVKKLPI